MSLLEHIIIDIGRIEELIDELEGALLMIAHEGYENNIPWVKERQKEIEEEYGALTIGFSPSYSKDGKQQTRGIDYLVGAYKGFMNLDLNSDSEEIKEEAANVVHSYITIPPPDDPIWQEEDIA